MTRLPTLLDAEVAQSQHRPEQIVDQLAQANLQQTDQLQAPTERVVEVTGEGARTNVDAKHDGRNMLDAILDRVGLERSRDGGIQLKDTLNFDSVKALGLDGIDANKALQKAMETMPAIAPPVVKEAVTHQEALAAFADGLGRGLDDLLTQVSGKPRMIDVVADDALTAVFMKLNILNPIDSEEMQNQLDEALTNLQQQLIAEIKKKLDNLYEQLKEAMASAMSGLFMAAILAAIVAAIVAAIIAGMVVAIITAAVVMAAMMMVRSMIADMIKQKIAEAKQQAEQMAAEAEKRVAEQIEQMREEKMQEIAELSMVGPDGEPLTEARMRSQLKPKLADALAEVTMILDSQGPEAAKAQGPQIIHDAMYEELLEMGLSAERADLMAWAIAEESMKNLALKLGMNDEGGTAVVLPPEPSQPVTPQNPTPPTDGGRHPGDMLGDQDFTPAADLTPVVPQSFEDAPVNPNGAPGRHPSEVFGSFSSAFGSLPPEAVKALTELMSSPLVEQAQGITETELGADAMARIFNAVQTQGIEQTLLDEVMAERSIAPATTLGLSAVLSASLPDEQVEAALNGDLDSERVVQRLAEAKDEALKALVEVGEASRHASQRIQIPSFYI